MPHGTAAKSRRQPHLLILPEEAALALAIGCWIDGRAERPVIRQFPPRTVAQTLLAARTIREEAEHEPLPHLAEIIFRTHRSQKTACYG